MESPKKENEISSCNFDQFERVLVKRFIRQLWFLVLKSFSK